MKVLIELAYLELVTSEYRKYYAYNRFNYKISRTRNGQWFICTKKGFHYEHERLYLDLDKFEYLKILLSFVELHDFEINDLGGRVTLTNKELITARQRF